MSETSKLLDITNTSSAQCKEDNQRMSVDFKDVFKNLLINEENYMSKNKDLDQLEKVAERKSDEEEVVFKVRTDMTRMTVKKKQRKYVPYCQRNSCSSLHSMANKATKID